MNGFAVDRFLREIWKDRNLVALLLWPASLLYCALVEFRRFAYTSGTLPIARYPQPVIVVGNLSVGGSGKTPFTIWLVDYLRTMGFSPGVVSRGYGRTETSSAFLVTELSAPAEVGDEPIIIARRTKCPVAVARRRSDAVDMLIRNTSCDVFISDDGLQHLALQSDLRIVLSDGTEGYGNSFCLPAGPLREPKARNKAADFLVVKDQDIEFTYRMSYRVTKVANLLNREKNRTLESLQSEKVVAVAGIHNPQKFFDILTINNITSNNISFPNHHRFTLDDFREIDDSGAVVLMTEKDAVKCEKFADPNWWYVAIEAVLEPAFLQAFEERFTRLVDVRSKRKAK